MKGKEIPHRVDHLVEDINNNQIIMVQCNVLLLWEEWNTIETQELLSSQGLRNELWREWNFSWDNKWKLAG